MKTEKKKNEIGKIFRFLLSCAVIFQCISLITQAQMYMGNSQHTGCYDSKPIIDGIGTKWTFKTNGPIVGSPAVSNNLVFVGSHDSCLYAVTLNGKEKWKKRTGGIISSTPAISGAYVYFISYDGYFYALDTTDGSEKWKFKTRGEHRRCGIGLNDYVPATGVHQDPYEPYQSSAVIVDSLVVFGCGDSSIYCLKIKDGSKLWEYKTQGVVHSSPAYSNGKIYCGGHDTKLRAINIYTGAKIWETTVGHLGTDVYSGNVSSPSISNGIVYIGSKDNYVGAFNAETGNKIFSYSTSSIWCISTPAISKNSVYSGTSGKNSLFKFNGSTGKELFYKYFLTSAYGTWTWSSAAIAGNMVYIGSSCGILMASDTSGNIKWIYRTIGNLNDFGKMYLFDGSQNPNSFGGIDFNTQEGNDRYQRKTLDAGGIWGHPTADKGVLYFGSGDGYLYALTEGFKNKTYFNNAALVLGSFRETKTYDSTLYIYNQGENSETYEIILDTIEQKSVKGFSFSPSTVTVNAKDSGKIKLSVNTKDVPNAVYGLTLIVRSKENAATTFYTKRISYSINKTNAVNSLESSEVKVFPNPVKSSVVFKYELKQSEKVYLEIFDIQGKSIIAVNAGMQNSGFNEIELSDLENLKPGSYFYRLQIGGVTHNGKLLK